MEKLRFKKLCALAKIIELINNGSMAQNQLNLLLKLVWFVFHRG